MQKSGKELKEIIPRLQAAELAALWLQSRDEPFDRALWRLVPERRWREFRRLMTLASVASRSIGAFVVAIEEKVAADEEASATLELLLPLLFPTDDDGTPRIVYTDISELAPLTDVSTRLLARVFRTLRAIAAVRAVIARLAEEFAGQPPVHEDMVRVLDECDGRLVKVLEANDFWVVPESARERDEQVFHLLTESIPQQADWD